MAARQKGATGEALSRPPKLDIRELREEWRLLYKADASPHLSRELLIRAVAYRMQEVALGGLRPEPQRQLRQIAQELKQTGEGAKRFRPQLKPGTRLMREWQGRTYEVVVLDDCFSPKKSGPDHAVPVIFLAIAESELHRVPCQEKPDPAIGWLHPGDAAHRGRVANRTSGVERSRR